MDNVEWYCSICDQAHHIKKEEVEGVVREPRYNREGHRRGRTGEYGELPDDQRRWRLGLHTMANVHVLIMIYTISIS